MLYTRSGRPPPSCNVALMILDSNYYVGVDKLVSFYQKSFLDDDFDFTFTKAVGDGSAEPVRFSPTIITMYLL